MEEAVRISAGSLSLEGLLGRRPGGKGVVVTHPHPLYGGDMHNNVVQALVDAYARAGFTTLRFNFRGTGGSEGRFENGEGEMDDVRHAATLLAASGSSAIHLAGYSFGTWVNARALNRMPEIRDVVMVSPPVDFMDFSFLGLEPRIGLVVTGERDEIAGASHLAELVPRWNPEAAFRVIPGADHFYHGRTDALQAVLEEHLAAKDTPEPGGSV
ncbi:MAG: alpha/beta fold hydrolase [Deltaproteobacteria bacterium]|nr:alpha/beta fold hydrolase [Deltaproteobacteria bacterium]